MGSDTSLTFKVGETYTILESGRKKDVTILRIYRSPKGYTFIEYARKDGSELVDMVPDFKQAFLAAISDEKVDLQEITVV